MTIINLILGAMAVVVVYMGVKALMNRTGV